MDLKGSGVLLKKTNYYIKYEQEISMQFLILGFCTQFGSFFQMNTIQQIGIDF